MNLAELKLGARSISLERLINLAKSKLGVANI